MSIEYIRFEIKKGDYTNFIEAIEKACIIVADYPDCLNYEVTQCEENPSLFIWRIEWTSTKSHLNGFRKSKIFESFYQLMEPFVNSILEMNHYQKRVIKIK